MGKLYEVWPGRNRFCSCGCLTGPLSDCCANSVYYICLLIVIIPYSIFMLGKIWTVNPAIPIVFFVCLIATTVFLYLTACTDPGIIPRRPFLEHSHSQFSKYLDPLPPDSGIDFRRYCETCHIYRPPRASHCSTCGNCVEVFDHHCPFVNNCIGKRNYRFFVCFLGGIMLTIITFFVNIVVFAISNTGEEINQTVLIIICSVIAGVIALPLLGFFIFHIYLAISGNTTREILKDIKGEKPQENQWCQVDPPIINYFSDISQEEASKLRDQLQTLRNGSFQRS